MITGHRAHEEQNVAASAPRLLDVHSLFFVVGGPRHDPAEHAHLARHGIRHRCVFELVESLVVLVRPKLEGRLHLVLVVVEVRWAPGVMLVAYVTFTGR